MSLLSQGELPHLIATYGYWAVAGFIALECLGIPVPGEATLIAAAVAGGTFHALNIWGVVGAASAGAIVGGTIGFWIGRELGFRLVVGYGKYIGLTEARIKLGQYLFLRHGGKVVFFGRFAAVLRAFAAFLAGVNCMPWPRFLVFNAAGAIVWAATYGFGAWYLGKEITRLAEPAAIALAIVVVIAAIGSFAFLYRHEAQLQARAEAAIPGPLRRVYARKQPAGDPRRDQSA
jgi:membrane protein DedA with SNARE-associated domain